MSEMVERVARTIDSELLRQYTANPKWDEAKDVIENVEAMVIARAAIEAMRKPESNVLKAGRDANFFTGNTLSIWEAMIDECLK